MIMKKGGHARARRHLRDYPDIYLYVLCTPACRCQGRAKLRMVQYCMTLVVESDAGSDRSRNSRLEGGSLKV